MLYEPQILSLLDSLINHSESEVLVADAEGTITNVNDRLVAHWGGERSDYIGSNCFELGPLELYGKKRRMVFKAALEGGEKITERFTDITPEGHVRHYTVNAFPLHDESGAISHMILTRKETTERIILEKRLRESMKMAAMGELSAYIAHEIRNPLFVIGGFAKRLLAMKLGKNAADMANIILEEALRLEMLCGSITSFAKPSELNLGDVDVNAVAEQTVEVMSFGAEEGNISMRLQLAQDIPKAHANTGILKQALVNIIKNAREALTEGGTIRVRTRYADTVIYLEVEDDGPGIPLELQDRIFNPFFSTKEQGSGLGLALTKKLLHEIDGTVYLSSRPGNTLISMALRPVFEKTGIAEGVDEANLPFL